MSNSIITDSISKDNICIWLNFKAYYSRGFRILSEVKANDGSVHFTVVAPSKKAFEQAMKDSNR
jgi:hypothetical protein